MLSITAPGSSDEGLDASSIINWFGREEVELVVVVGVGLEVKPVVWVELEGDVVVTGGPWVAKMAAPMAKSTTTIATTTAVVREIAFDKTKFATISRYLSFLKFPRLSPNSSFHARSLIQVFISSRTVG